VSGTATILPPPRFTAFDANGNPLAGGFVYTYIAGTTTNKTTWQDAGETTANSNPIVLDADGSCLLYGAGSYTLAVTDYLGNAVPTYSGLTFDLANITSASIPAVATIAALRLETTVTLTQNQCYVLGFFAGADGGEGAFWNNATDTTSTDNGITIFVDASSRRWYRETSGAPLNIAWAGGKPSASGATNVTAFNNALAALPTGGGIIVFGPGKYTFTSAFTYNYPSGKFAVTLAGAGADVTILYWAALNGITLNASNAFHSVHIRDLTLSTGSAGGYNALTLNNSVLEGPVAQSDIENVTIRGDDGGQQADYWTIGINLTGWSFFNYDTLLVYGNSTGAGGTGVWLSGNASTSPYYSVVHNFDKCGFYNLGTSFNYGTYLQGVTFSECNFVNGITGIYLASSTTGDAELACNNCNFNTQNNQIEILGPLAALIAVGNLFYVPAGNGGIYLNSTGSFAQIVGNTFSGASTTGSVGVLVTGNFLDGIVIGNVFYSLADGVNLVGTSTWNVQGNLYPSCTTQVANIGSNSVGVATK
jgi:hypothetical protein